MSSKGTNNEADVKPFSIRQYVVSLRPKNIYACWPFTEKYLQLCLNHGLKDVLPPIELPTTLAESPRGCSNLNCCRDDNNADSCKIEEPVLIEQQQNIKSEFGFSSNEERSKVTSQDCVISHEECSPHNCNVSNIVSAEADTFLTIPSSAYTHNGAQTLTSFKRMKHKWRRRKGKYCKKKSMAEILATAKHCTAEDLQRINKLCEIGSGIEGCHHMTPLENYSTSEIKDKSPNITAAGDYLEVANVDVIGKKTCLVKIKLNGYKSYMGNII
ncbi:hypothetical protein L6164_012047 [Bauhinia variegata]|uniref:Uncharacterized protein n=1 Tax=Bauhinia variegata TaxID=167791 RepID=A0ACB9P7Y4_BAUVA|nr:hypothetical protein L6164_012047 [Bauhinia variegata]